MKRDEKLALIREAIERGELQPPDFDGADLASPARRNQGGVFPCVVCGRLYSVRHCGGYVLLPGLDLRQHLCSRCAVNPPMLEYPPPTTPDGV